jgi:predicted metal-binding membrane protein
VVRRGLTAGAAVADGRVVTCVALAVATAVSWWLMARSAAVMNAMEGDPVMLGIARAMMAPEATGPYLGASALMWIVMMAAMMTPAAVPITLVFLRLDRERGAPRTGSGLLFAAGYLTAWFGFALVATVVQWLLHRAALLHGMTMVAGPVLAGATLLVAGIFQLTPIKEACLAHCRTPMGFLLGHWQAGPYGAFRMGLHHGTFCLGCCWALMLVMFAAGVMSVAAMAVLTVFILAERLLPGRWATHLPGGLLIAWGAWTLVAALA